MVKLLLAALFFSLGVEATELDPVPGLAQEIIVREDTQGNREVFKVADKVNVQDTATAAVAIEAYVTRANKVETVVPASELDRVTSTEAWYYWGWNYGYWWGGYNYNYRPYYSYSWGYYNYYYYRCW